MSSKLRNLGVGIQIKSHQDFRRGLFATVPRAEVEGIGYRRGLGEHETPSSPWVALVKHALVDLFSNLPYLDMGQFERVGVMKRCKPEAHG